jgi:hypothetical protein
MLPRHAATRRGLEPQHPLRSYGEIRALARRVLPGARFRHRLLWRYSITWTKPAA